MGEQYPDDQQTQSRSLIPAPRTSSENGPGPRHRKPDADELVAHEAPKMFHPAWIAVGALAAAGIAGVALETTEHQLGRPEQEINFRDDFPISYTPKQHELASILRADTCKTRVSPRQVTDIATVVMGNPSAESTWSASAHAAAIDAAVTRLDHARERLTLAQLPFEKIRALEADALADTPELSFGEYMATFAETLQHYGLTALFYWGNNSVSGVYESVQSLSYEQLEASTQARRVVVATMNTLAQTPVELVRLSGVQRIVFGDITSDDGEKYSGLTTSDSRDIYLDVSNDVRLNNIDSWSIPMHELTHLIDYRLCGTTKFARRDVSYGKLNGDFTYGRDSQTILEQQEATIPPNPAMQLATPVVARPYGARNAMEDKATLLGEDVYFVGNQGELFSPNKDLSILGYKIALELARLAKANPALATYYVRSLQLTRLMQSE